MKIVIGVNTLTSVDHAVYTNHCQFWYRLGREFPFPEYQFILNHPRRMSIDNMRNMTAKIAVQENADYLMFIDDDVIIPMDTLRKLIDTQADIAAGWTIIRGYPFENMFFKYADEAHTQLQKPLTKDLVRNAEGLFDVDAVGFSCVLIKVDLLKKIEPPYFVTGPFHTEDVYFCLKAEHTLRDKGEKVKIVVHPEIETAHCLGTEYIEPKQVELWQKFVEDQNEGIKDRVAEESPIVAAPQPDPNLPSYEQILKEAIFD